MKPIPAGYLCDDQTFSQIVERLHAFRHTGAVVIHFAQGHAVTVEVPCAPTRIKLNTGRDKRE